MNVLLSFLLCLQGSPSHCMSVVFSPPSIHCTCVLTECPTVHHLHCGLCLKLHTKITIIAIVVVVLRPFGLTLFLTSAGDLCCRNTSPGCF